MSRLRQVFGGPGEAVIVLHFAPAGGFVAWMAAHPGYVIVSTLTGRRGFPGCWTLLMEKREPSS